MTTLNIVLNYIDNAVINNNYKDQYIYYIDIIHSYFLNLEEIDFGVRYEILELCNLIITELINHENEKLQAQWIKLRHLIVSNIIEQEEI